MCQSTSNQLSFFNVCQPLSLRQIQWREPFESWKTPRDNFLKPCRLLAKIPKTDSDGLMFGVLYLCQCDFVCPCGGTWLHWMVILVGWCSHPSWPSAVRFFEEDVEQTAQITRAKCHLWLVPLAQGINRSCGWKVTMWRIWIIRSKTSSPANLTWLENPL